jgi:undecaprenyl-diphosphatase
MVQSLDTKLFFLINQGCSNSLLNILTPIVTMMGTSEFILLVGVALLFFPDSKRRRLALILFAGITLTYFTVDFLKGWVARPRPCEVLSGVNLLMKAGGFSFPSGHTAMAFMAQTVLSYGFKKWRIAFFILALSVGFARIYAGAHYPLDVLGGIAVGMGEGYALLAIARLCRIDL